MKTCDLVIVGGGPAGLAAAVSAKKKGCTRVTPNVGLGLSIYGLVWGAIFTILVCIGMGSLVYIFN